MGWATDLVKKLFKSEGWINHLDSRARSEQHKNAKKKSKGRKRNAVQVVSGRARIQESIPAPANFSVVENPEQVVAHMNRARQLLQSDTPVRFELKNITKLSPDAIAFFIAHFNDKGFNRGIKVEGSLPKNPELRDTMHKSGFLEHVSYKAKVKSDKNNLLLHKVTNNKVENTIAREACEQALGFIGKTGKFRPLYEVFIEFMANTNNHASPEEKGKYDWWMFVYNKPGSTKSCITFLDLGVGIFESIPVRGFRKIKQLVSPNANLVDDLLSGRIGSVTGLSERGRGLPLTAKHAKNPSFERFYMISNDVLVNLKNGVARPLSNSFQGTLYYIELINAQPGSTP